MSKVECVKGYYDEGGPRAEEHLLDGKLHGRRRFWHKNGQPYFEGHYKHGVPDGVGVCWDEKGREICRYEIVDGTGTEFMYFPNPRAFIVEIPWVNGVKHGVERYRGMDGLLTMEALWLNDKNVSLEDYEKACEADPSLSRLTLDPTKWSPEAVAKFTGDWDEYGREILKKDGVHEVRAWLEEGRTVTVQPLVARKGWEPLKVGRTLGESNDEKASKAIAESLYAAGAKTVWVYEVDEETQNSGRLLVELPDDLGKRAAVLKVCNNWATKQGLKRHKDRGQQYIQVKLD